MNSHRLALCSLVLSIGGAIGCASNFANEYSLQKPSEDATMDARVSGPQEALLDEGLHLLDQGRFQESEVRFRTFLSRYPDSVYTAQVHLGLARSWEGLNNWEKALTNYEKSLSLSSVTNEALFALASFYSSKSWEMSGQEDKALASLRDAERRESLLPIDIRRMDLPARLAQQLMALGQLDIARRYLTQASKGVAASYPGFEATAQEAQAKKLYELGQIANSPDHPEKSLEISQELLMDCMALETKWAEQAAKLLEARHRDVAKRSVAQYENVEDQRMHVQAHLQLLDTLDRLIQTKTVGTRRAEVASIVRTKKWVEELTQNGFAFLSATAVTLPMTPEAKKRNSLRKNLRTEP